MNWGVGEGKNHPDNNPGYIYFHCGILVYVLSIRNFIHAWCRAEVRWWYREYHGEEKDMVPIKRETIAIVMVSYHILSIMVDTQLIYKMSYIKYVHLFQNTIYLLLSTSPKPLPSCKENKLKKISQPTWRPGAECYSEWKIQIFCTFLVISMRFKL